MTHPSPPARRAFLQHLGALAALAPALGTRAALPLAAPLAGLGALAAARTHAQPAGSDYKAIVCLFMAGGNDCHNLLVPTDPASHTAYAAPRRALAWAPHRLLPITAAGQASGRSFGLAPELAPLHPWYEAGDCALVANIGPLERPLSLADYKAGRGVPRKLFSHNDQQSMWQSMHPEGAPSGWGGRMGDLLMAANQRPVLTTVSVGGNVAFLAGRTLTQYRMGTTGPVLINATQGGWHAGSNTVPAALGALLAGSGRDAFEQEYLDTVRRSLDTASTVATALAASGVPALPTGAIALPSGGSITLATESLAQQLRVVVQMVAAGPALGLRRQVFMVVISGFDTHSDQLRNHPLLLGRVAHAADWFLATLQARGLLDQVVLFSASEFGRALTSNGDGCDHGWGGHHFVAGGGVKGRTIHGRFPVVALGSPDDAGSGRLLPTLAVTQLAADLGRWLGLSATDVADVLPDLAQFGASVGVVG